MKNFYFNYYKEFKCVSTECKHNCCIGWKINIDKKSLKAYRKIKGDFSSRIVDGVNIAEGNFVLKEGDRCAFLNKNNLCDIISNFGEEKLCQVCKDHPRFRNFYHGFSETGLGLSCEEACRIILGYKDKIEIEGEERAYNSPFLSKGEKITLKTRKSILEILQNRDIPLSKRVENLQEKFGISDNLICGKDIAKFLKTLEILNKEWKESIQNLEKSHQLSTADFSKILDGNSLIFEQLIVYFIYRHFNQIQGEQDIKIKLCFCLRALYIIARLFNISDKLNFENISEIARSFSAEIEYSENNLQTFLDKIEGEIFLDNLNK